MKSPTRIKVSRDQLLEHLQGRKAQLEQDHAENLALYKAEVKEYLHAVEAALLRAYEQSRDGAVWPPNSRYDNGVVVAIGVKEPSPPTLSLSRLDRLIKTLELSVEVEVMLSADDAQEYIG